MCRGAGGGGGGGGGAAVSPPMSYGWLWCCFREKDVFLFLSFVFGVRLGR